MQPIQRPDQLINASASSRVFGFATKIVEITTIINKNWLTLGSIAYKSSNYACLEHRFIIYPLMIFIE